MTVFDAPGQCAACRWWHPHDEDSETGICRSVLSNDYARADLVRRDDGGGPVLLITYSDFGCIDFSPEDE